MIQILGYAASAIIVLSLTMTSVVRLRIIGLVGAVLFTTYGVLVDAIPVAITNGIIVALHAFFLWRAYTDEEFFTLLEVRPESRYLAQFLNFYGDDIRLSQPDFTFEERPDLLTMFILRDMVPAGLFVARPAGEATMQVDLDYVIPRYRDLEVARFLFRRDRRVFADRNVRFLCATGSTDRHRTYLRRMGFSPAGDDRFELDLD